MHREPPVSPEVWERIPPEAQAYIRALEAQVGALEETVPRWPAAILQLEATGHQVREQLPQHSRTSSRPPASAPPQVFGQRPRRAPRGRRPAGPPGHAGQTRALLPVEEVDAVIPVTPARCPRCQPPWLGADPQPPRHHVTELPPGKPGVTASPLHRLVGPVCGEATRAEVPAGVPAGGVGPRRQGLTALCTGASHLSKRTTQTVLADLCGVSMGLGTVAHLEQATAQVLVEPVAEARASGQAQATADLDETGWRERRQRAWLWAAVTAGVTVLVMRLSRRGKVAPARLGDRFWGSLGTDRWSA